MTHILKVGVIQIHNYTQKNLIPGVFTSRVAARSWGGLGFRLEYRKAKGFFTLKAVEYFLRM